MSHAIYQTPAIILKAKNMRESNKLLVLYTQKFGLVYITTQSIRELKSKMRFHTNTLSLVDVDMVRGRNIWKLTGIHENYSSLGFAGGNWHIVLNRISMLILRLCSGEEAHNDIWNDIKNIYKLVESHSFQDLKYYEAVEIIFAVRLLSFLGYWHGKEEILSQKNPFYSHTYQVVLNNKNLFIQKINEGIQNSQL